MDTHRAHSAGVIAPPPLLYSVAFILGLGLQLTWPLPLRGSVLTRSAMAASLLLASAALARWAFISMRGVGTTPSPYRPSTSLTVTGPFRLSRNPIYVAMTGLYSGAAFLVNSSWPLVLLVPLLWIMHHGVIVREERYLAGLFGDAYDTYKARVRRWL